MLATNTKTLRSRRGMLGATLALLSGASFLAACTAKDSAATKAAPLADPHAGHKSQAHSTPKVSTLAPAGTNTVAFIEVWKTPTCGCCKLWVEHLEKEGFSVKANDVPQTAPIRTQLRIPDDMGSCHTGLIAGFAVEGHVPAQEIRRLLSEPESLRQQVIERPQPGRDSSGPSGRDPNRSWPPAEVEVGDVEIAPLQ